MSSSWPRAALHRLAWLRTPLCFWPARPQGGWLLERRSRSACARKRSRRRPSQVPSMRFRPRSSATPPSRTNSDRGPSGSFDARRPGPQASLVRLFRQQGIRRSDVAPTERHAPSPGRNVHPVPASDRIASASSGEPSRRLHGYQVSARPLRDANPANGPTRSDEQVAMVSGRIPRDNLKVDVSRAPRRISAQTVLHARLAQFAGTPHWSATSVRSSASSSSA